MATMSSGGVRWKPQHVERIEQQVLAVWSRKRHRQQQRLHPSEMDQSQEKHPLEDQRQPSEGTTLTAATAATTTQQQAESGREKEEKQAVEGIGSTYFLLKMTDQEAATRMAEEVVAPFRSAVAHVAAEPTAGGTSTEAQRVVDDALLANKTLMAMLDPTMKREVQQQQQWSLLAALSAEEDQTPEGRAESPITELGAADGAEGRSIKAEEPLAAPSTKSAPSHVALADLMWWLFLARGPHSGLSFLPQEKTSAANRRRRRPRGVHRIMSNGKRLGDLLVRELQAELKKRGSTISGRKAVLVQRLADVMDAEDLRKEQEELERERREEATRKMEAEMREKSLVTAKGKERIQLGDVSADQRVDAMDIDGKIPERAAQQDEEKLALFRHLAPAVLLLAESDVQACDRVFIRPPDLQLAPIYDLFGQDKGDGEEDDDDDELEGERRGLTTRRLLLRMRRASQRDEWQEVAQLIMQCLVHSARIRVSFHSVSTCRVEMEPVINELLSHKDPEFILNGLLLLKELLAEDPFSLFAGARMTRESTKIGPGLPTLLCHPDWRIRQTVLTCMPTKNMLSSRFMESGLGVGPEMLDIIIQMAMSDDMPLVRLQALEQLVNYYLQHHPHKIFQKLLDVSIHCMKSVDPDIAVSGVNLLGITCIHNLEPTGNEAKQEWADQCRRAMRALIDLILARHHKVPPLLRLSLQAIARHFNALNLNGTSAAASEKLSVLPEELRLACIKEIEAERIHRLPKEKPSTIIMALLDNDNLEEEKESRQDNDMVLLKTTKCISHLLNLACDPFIDEITDSIKRMLQPESDWTMRECGLLLISSFPSSDLPATKWNWVTELALNYMSDPEPEIRVMSCHTVSTFFECPALVDRGVIVGKASELLRDSVHKVRLAAVKLLYKGVSVGASIWRDASEVAEKIIKECMAVITEVTDASKVVTPEEKLENEHLVCGLLNVMCEVVGARPYEAEPRIANLLPFMLSRLLPMLQSSGGMVRKEIIDLVLQLSHYRDSYHGFEASMRFQFHEQEVLKVADHLLTEHMQALQQSNKSEERPTTTRLDTNGKGKDKGKEKDEEEDPHQDALWDSLVLVQGLLRTDTESVVATLKIDNVVSTVITLLGLSERDHYHRELAFDILDTLFEHEPPSSEDKLAIVFSELTRTITDPETMTHEWVSACHLIQRLAPLKFLDPKWVTHTSAWIAQNARHHYRSEVSEHLADAIRPILLFGCYHAEHVHPRVLSLLALITSSSPLGTVDFRMVEGFANLMTRFYPSAPPSAATASSSSSSSSSSAAKPAPKLSIADLLHFTSSSSSSSSSSCMAAKKAPQEKKRVDHADAEAAMPLLDYAAPSLLVSFASFLAQTQRQEDERNLKTSRQRRAEFSRATRSLNGGGGNNNSNSTSRLIGSRIDQIHLLGGLTAGGGGGEFGPGSEARRKKQETEKQQKAREEKIRAALLAMTSALWPRVLARELLRLHYEQREELSYALARYLPGGHELIKTLNNPHGVDVMHHW